MQRLSVLCRCEEADKASAVNLRNGGAQQRLLARCLLKRKIIQKRQAALDEELEGAKKSREEAQAVVDSSKETIDEAKRKASEIMEEAKANAEKQSKQVINQANEEAQHIIERAEEDAARMKRNAFETMKDDIADLSVQIAGHIIGDAVSKDELKKSAAKHTEEILDKEVAKSE